MNKNTPEDIFKGVGVEVELLEDDGFLKIKETLTRIGIPSKKDKTLYQSCHILHKRDRETGKSRFVILSFKEMFVLDGKTSNVTEEDLDRRDRIVKMLEEWNLVRIIDEVDMTENTKPFVKVIPFSQKKDWNLVEKYSIGKKKTT